jgi:ubiquinone/menaquinone biosynthesis C-methylase UbiE
MNMVDRSAEMWQPPAFFANETMLQNMVSQLRRYVDLQAGSLWQDLAEELPGWKGDVLDVGCGAQPYRKLMGSQARYIGLDTYDVKAHFGYEMPNTVYYDGHKLPFASQSMDRILCTETMEHVWDTNLFLSELERVLRSKGTIILTVPFAARWHYIPHDYWRFTPSALNALLLKAGFQNIRVYSRGNFITVAAYKLMATILPLFFSRSPTMLLKLLKFATGLLCVPILAVLACIGTISLCAKSGDDCLGYTVLAEKS